MAGGSTCSGLLAKWGLKTLLIEKNGYIGGKAVTLANKDGFSPELGPKLQVPAQGPSCIPASWMCSSTRRLRGSAEVSEFTRDSVLEGQGGGCIGLG